MQIAAPVWEWRNQYDGWERYDNYTSTCFHVSYLTELGNLIEEEHQNGAETVSLNHGFFGESGGYTIDFEQMVQYRDSSGNERQIRRVPPTLPRGAGNSMPMEVTPMGMGPMGMMGMGMGISYLVCFFN